jgi:kynurenine formamidase
MKIIDLTHQISENMPMYPGTDAPTLHTACSYDEHGFAETLIGLYSHTGTHIDAPSHLYANGTTLDKYPIEQFVGNALVIDCRNLSKGAEIPMALLYDKGDALWSADFLLFLTGHSHLWGTPCYFAHYPVPSQEVVEWVNQRKLKGIGIDAPSFDPVSSEDEQTVEQLPNHRAILKTNRTVLIENLCKLEDIGDEMCMLYALPLYTIDADGAPARIIAVVH